MARAILGPDGKTIVDVEDPNNDGVGGLAVYVQDQVSPTISQFLMKGEGTFTLAATTVPNAWTFTATGGHGIVVGKWVTLVNHVHFFQAMVSNVVADTITLDRPIDHTFDATLILPQTLRIMMRTVVITCVNEVSPTAILIIMKNGVTGGK